MKEKLEQRLDELKAEFESGQNMLDDLRQRQKHLEETLLRISGAIQVIEEVIAQESQPTGEDVDLADGASESIESNETNT